MWETEYVARALSFPSNAECQAVDIWLCLTENTAHCMRSTIESQQTESAKTTTMNCKRAKRPRLHQRRQHHWWRTKKKKKRIVFYRFDIVASMATTTNVWPFYELSSDAFVWGAEWDNIVDENKWEKLRKVLFVVVDWTTTQRCRRVNQYVRIEMDILQYKWKRTTKRDK